MSIVDDRCPCGAYVASVEHHEIVRGVVSRVVVIVKGGG